MAETNKNPDVSKAPRAQRRLLLPLAAAGLGGMMLGNAAATSGVASWSSAYLATMLAATGATALAGAAFWIGRQKRKALADKATDQPDIDEALQIARENLRLLFAAAPVGMLLLDEQKVIADVNSHLALMVSADPKRMIDQRAGNGLGCTHSRENEKGCGHAAACRSCKLWEGITQALTTGMPAAGAEFQPTLIVDGQERRPCFSVRAVPMQLAGRRHVVVALHDVSDRKRAEEELRKSTAALQAINAEWEEQQAALITQTQELRALLESIPGATFLKDREGRYIAVNTRFCSSLGKTHGDVIGATDGEIFPPELARKHLADDQKLFSAETPALETEEVLVREDKREWLLTRKMPVPSADGTIERLVGVSIDITAQKTMEEELRAAVRTDKLTGLPNRALLCERLQKAVLRHNEQPDHHFALMFLDCDRFQSINDSLGRHVGDLLLKEMALRLRAAIRAGDLPFRNVREHTTARLGSDKFAVLLDGLESMQAVKDLAEKVLDIFAQPSRVGEHEVHCTASMGIVTSDASSTSAEAVLRDADTAIYEAKLAGKARCVVFDVSMRDRLDHRLQLERDLRRALDAGELFLMYQPIISLQTGAIEGYEALLRWQHPQRGLISPDEFIGIAEETGLILPIGEWVLREACRQFARWRSNDRATAPPNISVNLSRKQLAQPDLPANIRQILAQTGVAPDRLHLEVTESTIMANPAAATAMLRSIRNLGVKLDMDDFGTGHSSLACLHQFPIDVLKIDRSFIANLNRGREFAALVHAVVQLAGNLNIRVVAEGIESLDQALVLQSFDCDFGQGYLFSKPMLPEHVPAFKFAPVSLPGAAGQCNESVVQPT